MTGQSGASLVAIAVLIAATLTHTGAGAQTPTASQPAAAGADELRQNFQAQHEIGRRFHIDPADLPAPKVGPIVTDRPLTMPYSGQTPQVPEGFTATAFATGLMNPRRLLVLPNGDILVAEQGPGYLTLLRDDGRGTPAGSIATSRISTSPTASLGRATMSWWRTRTASGACRISSARCGPAATSKGPSTRSRPTSASPRPVPMGPGC